MPPPDVESQLGCLSDVAFDSDAAQQCISGASASSCPTACGSLLGSVCGYPGLRVATCTVTADPTLALLQGCLQYCTSSVWRMHLMECTLLQIPATCRTSIEASPLLGGQL